jgi:hypothetical protein
VVIATVPVSLLRSRDHRVFGEKDIDEALEEKI